MHKLYVPLLIVFTSLVGYLYTKRTLRFDRSDLRRAINGTLECIGCWVVVYGANILFGLALILLIRQLTGFFISLYVLKSVLLVLFTLSQALVLYHLWCVHRRE